MLSTEKPLKEKTIATSTTFYTFHFFLYNINFSFVWNKKEVVWMEKTSKNASRCSRKRQKR